MKEAKGGLSAFVQTSQRGPIGLLSFGPTKVVYTTPHLWRGGFQIPTELTERPACVSYDAIDTCIPGQITREATAEVFM